MKKYSKFLIQIALVLLFVVPLEIMSVRGAWIYFNKPAESKSVQLGIKLAKFFPDGQSEDSYVHDFDENDKDAQTNKDIFETIMGDKKEEYDKDNDIGLFNPSSDIARIINDLPDGELITSIDTSSKILVDNKTSRELFGPDFAASVGLNPGEHFAIKKESGGQGDVRTVYVYTTSTLLFTNNNDYQTGNDVIYEDGFIDKVYRANLLWKQGFGVLDDGYNIINSELGYCRQGVLPNNNPNHNFFLPDTWVHGENHGIDVRLTKGTEPFELGGKFTVKAYDNNNNELSNVNWSISDSKYLSVNKNGVVSIKKNPDLMDFKFKSFSVTATVGDVSGSYKFKLNITPDKTNRGIVIDSKGHLIQPFTAENLSLNTPMTLYTDGITSQGVFVNNNNGQSKFTVKIQCNTNDFVVKVHNADGDTTDASGNAFYQELETKLISKVDNVTTYEFNTNYTYNTYYITINALTPVIITVS